MLDKPPDLWYNGSMKGEIKMRPQDLVKIFQWAVENKPNTTVCFVNSHRGMLFLFSDHSEFSISDFKEMGVV